MSYSLVGKGRGSGRITYAFTVSSDTLWSEKRYLHLDFSYFPQQSSAVSRIFWYFLCVINNLKLTYKLLWWKGAVQDGWFICWSCKDFLLSISHQYTAVNQQAGNLSSLLSFLVLMEVSFSVRLSSLSLFIFGVSVTQFWGDLLGASQSCMSSNVENPLHPFQNFNSNAHLPVCCDWPAVWWWQKILAVPFCRFLH